MKVSIVVPVYFNEKNLMPLYEDIKAKFIDKIDYEYEIVMVDDGSEDGSFEVMKQLSDMDPNVKCVHLSRNFGMHAALLCGFEHCTGDCAIMKAADLQEPTEMLLEMVESWKSGNNVVLAVRDGRDEAKSKEFFANLYYTITRKFALSKMPKTGFDVYLIDRKVIEVLSKLDEKNSTLTCQILWSGFKTGYVYYTRLAREIGESKWSLKKKIRMVMDTLFSFSNVPIQFVTGIGTASVFLSAVWAIYTLISWLLGQVPVRGWTMMFIFMLFAFGVIMCTLGIIGEYMWRTFDASRNRPVYIVEETYEKDSK